MKRSPKSLICCGGNRVIPIKAKIIKKIPVLKETSSVLIR